MDLYDITHSVLIKNSNDLVMAHIEKLRNKYHQEVSSVMIHHGDFEENVFTIMTHVKIYCLNHLKITNFSTRQLFFTTDITCLKKRKVR